MRVALAKLRLRANRSAAAFAAATTANGGRALRSVGPSTSTMNRLGGWEVRWRFSKASASAGSARCVVQPSIGGRSARGGPARLGLPEAASPIRPCLPPQSRYAAHRACLGLGTRTAAQCSTTCPPFLHRPRCKCPLRIEVCHRVAAVNWTFRSPPANGRRVRPRRVVPRSMIGPRPARRLASARRRRGDSGR